jgi:hypothetical protein
MMKLDGDSAFLELDRSEVGSPETPADQDVLLNVTVQVGSYSAADQCWIGANDLKRFLSELRELEADRQGQAILLGASLDDLRLEFYSTDSVGHMGVKGHLGWNRSEEFPLQLKFGFGFEPDRLRSLLEYFETMTCG